MFRASQCLCKGARRAEERRRKKKKMTKPDFHRFLARYLSNIFKPSYGSFEDGATPESKSKCLWAYKINHRGKYQRLNANTCIVAAILFFRSSLHREALPCLPNNDEEDMASWLPLTHCPVALVRANVENVGRGKEAWRSHSSTETPKGRQNSETL